jgi:5-methylcytosine-specific restriction protein B
MEIIPLLQEMVYDDYVQLQEFLGKALVNAEEQRLTAVADDPSQLVAALVAHYQKPADDA